MSNWKRKLLAWTLKHLDPGRKDRGLVTFDRPGSVSFNTDRVQRAERLRNKPSEGHKP